jgi:hypothetical protein
MSVLGDFVNTIAKVKQAIENPRNEQEIPNKNLGSFGGNIATGLGQVAQGIVGIPKDIWTGITQPEKVGPAVAGTIKNLASSINNTVGQPVNPDTGNLQWPSSVEANNYAYKQPVAVAANLSMAGGALSKLGVAGGAGEAAAEDVAAPAAETTTEAANTAGEANTAAEGATGAEEMVNKLPAIPDEEINAFKQANKITVPTKRAGVGDLDVNGTSEAMLQHIKSGMTIDPADAPALVTGKTGLSTQLTDQIVSNIKTPVVVNDAVDAATKILDANKTVIDPTTRASVIADIQRGTEATDADVSALGNGQRLVTDPESGVSSVYNDSMDGPSALKYARQLETKGSQFGRQSTYLTPNAKWEIVQKAFNSAADQVMGHVNDAAVADNAASGIDIEAAVAKANQISPLYGQQVRDALTSDAPVDNIRSTAAPFVKYQKIMDISKNAQNSVGYKMAANKMGTLNPLPVTAEEAMGSSFGLPGKVVGRIADKAMQREVPQVTNDFSKPWVAPEAAASAVPAASKFPLLGAVANTVKTVAPAVISANAVADEGQPAVPGGSAPTTTTPTNAPKYTPPTLPNGFLNVNDYTQQSNKLSQQIADTSINDPVASASLTGQLNQLKTSYANQQPIRDEQAKTAKISTLSSNAYNLINKADPSLLNLNGTFDSLLKSTDPTYSALGAALKYIQDTTGVDLAHAKNKEALLSALDYAYTTQTNNYNALTEEFFGGSMPGQGTTTTTNLPPVQSINQAPAESGAPDQLPAAMLQKNTSLPQVPPAFPQ